MKKEIDIELIGKLIEYIENTEQTLEWEWGHCRSLKELIETKKMPDVYYELMELKK